MSSHLMNSTAYSDPKFPPNEEYSQGNYIPSHGVDYYTHPYHHHHHHPHHQQHPHHQHRLPSHHQHPQQQHHHHHPYAGYPLSGPVSYGQENGRLVYGAPNACQHYYRPQSPCGMGPVSPLPRTPTLPVDHVMPTSSLIPVPSQGPNQHQRSPVVTNLYGTLSLTF
ncbi:uncharacterized protein TNCV_3037431 [Trichonephila clavipes]|nr:uncharacterized protein TNCV_3037431 [Trichonephila clavipes]